MTTYAGLYGPEALIDSTGKAITSATIDVFQHGTTTHVSLYQDNGRVTPLSNPVPNGVDGSTAGRGLDTYGNLSFYVNPGVYDLRIATGAGTRTVEIEVETDPAESATSNLVQVALTTLAAARPSRWFRVYNVGTSQKYTTINAAIVAFQNDFKLGQAGPWFRCLLTVDPGTYSEVVGLPEWLDLVGTSGNRDDVVITADSVTPLSIQGTSYVANVTVKVTGTASQAGGGGAVHVTDTVGISNGTVLLENVRGITTNPNHQALFTTPSNGGFVGVYGSNFHCELTQVSGTVTYPIEAETSPGVGNTRPARHVFYDCTATYTDATFGSQAVAAVHLFGQGSGVPDTFYWINGPNGYIQSDPNWSQIYCGQGTVGSKPYFVIDPAVSTLAGVSGLTDSTSQVIRQVPTSIPVPVDGMHETTRAEFLPDRIYETRTRLLSVPDVTVAALTANRVYYVPVEVEAAIHLVSLLAFAQSASGNVGIWLYPDSGGQPSGVRLLSLSASGLQATVSGRNTITPNIPYSGGRYIYPRQLRVWAAFMVDNATAEFLVTTALSTMRSLYYEDTAGTFPTSPTPVALSAGTPVPVLGYITN